MGPYGVTTGVTTGPLAVDRGPYEGGSLARGPYEGGSLARGSYEGGALARHSKALPHRQALSHATARPSHATARPSHTGPHTPTSHTDLTHRHPTHGPPTRPSHATARPSHSKALPHRPPTPSSALSIWPLITCGDHEGGSLTRGPWGGSLTRGPLRAALSHATSGPCEGPHLVTTGWA